MKFMKKSSIRVGIILFLIGIVFLFVNYVQAAGVDGTVIVLNPRAWWNLGWVCQWF